MNETPAKELEQRVAHQLRCLPMRRAPSTLQSRVWRELERRVQLPWWFKPFGNWPLTARGALVMLCLAIATGTVNVFNGMSSVPRGAQLTDLMTQSFGWAENLATAIQGLQSFIALLLRHAPTPWLYGGGMALVVLYAALLVVGTAAYRTLYVHR